MNHSYFTSLCQLDVSAALLHGDIDVEVCMKLPHGLELQNTQFFFFFSFKVQNTQFVSWIGISMDLDKLVDSGKLN